MLPSSSFVLAGLQPRVQSMFELTRLHRVFEIYASLQEALDGGGKVPMGGASDAIVNVDIMVPNQTRYLGVLVTG